MLNSLDGTLLDRVDRIPPVLRQKLPTKSVHRTRGRQQHLCHCQQSSDQGHYGMPDKKFRTLFAASLSNPLTFIRTFPQKER